MDDNVPVRRFRPWHGLLVVLAFAAAVLGAEYLLGGPASRRTFLRVSPDRQGNVVVDAADLKPLAIRFYHFLNRGNQEVKFFVARDESGAIQVAFDAAETDYKRRLGFRLDGAWIVNNKCGTAVRLADVNSGRGGCTPVPLPFRVDGTNVVLAENDILTGWRYFR